MTVHREPTSHVDPRTFHLATGSTRRVMPHGDRISVVTAGRFGNMEAQLGASEFDVVAAAETDDALIDAVSADEPDAIVVEADLLSAYLARIAAAQRA